MKHNLQTLKLFLSIAKTQSFAQASEVENIAASAISKRISDLEHHIGTPLFYRQTKGVELTPAGREMVLHASNIMRLVERMDANMGDYASGLRGTVRIAANTSAITQFLPEDLACFVELHPDMKIELTEQTSEEILDAVRDGLADVGIFSGQISPSDLDELTYRRDTLVVIMAKTHPFVSAAPVTLAEISQYNMVGLHRGSSLQAFLENCSAAQGLNLKTRVDVQSFDGVRRMVEAGLGIAVLPLGAVEPYLETANLRMLAIAEPWAQRTLKLALRDSETTTRPIRMLVEHLTAQALPTPNE